MKDFIILPTYNERENIATILDRLFSLYPDIFIVVVDDNSPDGTARVVKEFQEKYPALHLHSRPGKLGLASAYLESFEKILREHADTRSIITMDADLSHPLETIGVMREMLPKYDLLIGSRYVPGGKLVNWPQSRKILSMCANMYLKIFARVPINDLTAGFQCFRTDLLRNYDFSTIESSSFAFLIEMKVAAHRMGARICEIPITFTDRVNGASKMPIRTIHEEFLLPWKLHTLWRKKTYHKL